MSVSIYLSMYTNHFAVHLKQTQYCKSTMRECVLSPFSCVQLFVNLWTVAYQAPLSMGFSRQEYWSGLSGPPPGDRPNPGIELTSLMSSALAGGFFTTNTTWEACKSTVLQQKINSTAAACKVPPSPHGVTCLSLSFLVCQAQAMVRKLWGGVIDSAV